MASLEDLLFTLEICKKALPENSHPTHFERLREIEAILRRGVRDERPPAREVVEQPAPEEQG